MPGLAGLVGKLGPIVTGEMREFESEVGTDVTELKRLGDGQLVPDLCVLPLFAVCALGPELTLCLSA